MASIKRVHELGGKKMKVRVNGELVTVTEKEVAERKEEALVRGQEYLDLISDARLREAAEMFWEKAPDYFFVIPASATGKYHWAKELGGLFDHVLMGMVCAYELSRTFGLDDMSTDIALAAVAGHDCLKYGIDYDTRYFDMHPFLPRSYYKRETEEILKSPQIEDRLFSAIERHMGNLATGEWTSVGRVVPTTPIEQVVHLADFMSSRKRIVLK
jgi:hypothetical protein